MPIIRSATPADIPRILAIEQQSLMASHWTTDQYAKLIANGIVLVAVESTNLQGFLCASKVAGEWEIENVVVAPSSLRQGIASDLMQALIDQAKSANTTTIHLEVRESNLPARRLYEKHRFTETGRRPNYYQNPSETAVLYALHSQTNK
jgi:[ribosomal protein S18]-alanine N-acetyltransferase